MSAGSESLGVLAAVSPDWGPQNAPQSQRGGEEVGTPEIKGEQASSVEWPGPVLPSGSCARGPNGGILGWQIPL